VLADIPGILGVKCAFDHGGNWQPDAMTFGAQLKLADQRQFVRTRAQKGYTDFYIIEPAEVSSRREDSLKSLRSKLQTTQHEMEGNIDLPVCPDNHDHAQ
jgi:hypothetical protein